MPTIIDAIESRIKTLDLIISRLNENIPKRMEGDLAIAMERGNKRFYQVIEGKRKYIGKKNLNTLESLAQKQYEEKLLHSAVEERNKLLDILDVLGRNDFPSINDVLKSLDKDICALVKPDISTDDGFARRWSEERYNQACKTEKHRFETMGKDLVRSKSEVLIADRLYQAGIPYRYEQRLSFGDDFIKQRYYPDFTILNKRTREIFYWEHLGLLGDKGYCLDNLNKLDDYMRNGIIPGRNLILTFECEGKPLSTARVTQLIEVFLK